MNWCILIPLLVGLISAILGYLLGRLSSNNNNDTTDIDFWRNKNAQLEKDLAACRSSKSVPSKPVSESAPSTPSAPSAAAGFAAGAASTKSVASGVAFDAAAAKAAFGKKIKENDLKIVEGIGPKIAELFNDNGIHTWAELANTTTATLQSHLDTKGQRYRVHKPGTWPMQSGLAAEGKWSELKKWQDENDYGKA